MNGGVPGGGNGAMFRARTEKDAELHARELATRGGRKHRSRRERVIVATVLALTLVGWGLFELLA